MAFRSCCRQWLTNHKTVTPGGRQTTNAVEGFHGLALMYRDKRTDLGHEHYTCKTNMGICHKVIQYRIQTQNLSNSIIVTCHAESRANLESTLLFQNGSTNPSYSYERNSGGAISLGEATEAKVTKRLPPQKVTQKVLGRNKS